MNQSSWQELLNRKEFTWPAIAAIWIALFHLFGFIEDRGRTAALGIYDLGKPALSQDYVLSGSIGCAQLGLHIVLVVLAGLGLRAISKPLLRAFPNLQTRVASLAKARICGWLIVITVVVISLIGAFIGQDLMKNADALVLKPVSGAGIWTRIIAPDPDASPLIAYLFALALLLTGFLSMSYWVVTSFIQSNKVKLVYSTWVILQTLNLVASYAFVLGAGSTIQPYPIVNFSNWEQHVGKNAVTVLLGSDEREFAILVLFKGATQSETPSPSKTILYLPRSEVKWMNVIGQEPLQAIEYYHDWKQSLPPSPTKP
jgi:hypothetical protein